MARGMGVALPAAPDMKLIVVNRSKPLTYHRLVSQFAGVENVKVLLDRRVQQTRTRVEPHVPDRRRSDRRRLNKTLFGRDYIVVHLADTPERKSSAE